MIDTRELQAKWDAAREDKADLFDFYHEWFPTLMVEVKRHQERIAAEEEAFDERYGL